MFVVSVSQRTGDSSESSLSPTSVFSSTTPPIFSTPPTLPSLVTVTILSTESTGLHAQSNHDVGRIVGPVVGVIVLLVFTTISIILYRRRKTRNFGSSKELPAISPYPSLVTPAYAGRRKQHKQAHQRDIVVDAEIVTENRDGNTQLHAFDRENGQEVVESSAIPRGEAVIKYHDDSGWRPRQTSSIPPTFGREGPTVVEMPPQYDAAS
jgi:hypothetical protein